MLTPSRTLSLRIQADWRLQDRIGRALQLIGRLQDPVLGCHATSAQLADTFFVSTTAFKKQLTKLEEWGMIYRVQKNNRRHIYLTEYGKWLCDEQYEMPDGTVPGVPPRVRTCQGVQNEDGGEEAPEPKKKPAPKRAPKKAGNPPERKFGGQAAVLANAIDLIPAEHPHRHEWKEWCRKMVGGQNRRWELAYFELKLDELRAMEREGYDVRAVLREATLQGIKTFDRSYRLKKSRVSGPNSLLSGNVI